MYSLCSGIFSYSFFSKDSKSEISKRLCGSSPSARCHEPGYPHNATGNGNYRQSTLILSPRHLIRGLVGSWFMKKLL
ncbi:MAG: hypothetical protein HN595_08315, partial [Flavobacteriaceae bacterium]|nr:hypothetical protein [Flavobacteriaceae bacterium]